METRSLALADLSIAGSDVFETWAGRHGVSLIHTSAPALPSSRGKGLLLAVMEISGQTRGWLERVQSALEAVSPCPLVVLADRIRVDDAVKLIKLGTADVIELPMQPGELVTRATSHALPRGRRGSGARRLIGDSAVAQSLRRDIETVARLRCSVLLLGETGVGKGLVARLIHDASDRRDEPFVHVDCASLAPSVIESEFFGHERGAFTGAVSQRKGRFEQAGAGTIFLDEIGEIEPSLQAKLLRVLHERCYERVGGTRTLAMRARVIAATNRDLDGEVGSGRFRADLYFRLNVFELRIPPLRERSEDLPQLVQDRVLEVASRLSLPVPKIAPQLLLLLREHSWPGNVRELHNVIERLMVRNCNGALDAGALRAFAFLAGPAFASRPRNGTPSPVVVPERPAPIEARPAARDRERIATTLTETGGNIARAARRLDMPRSTLRYRIARYRLHDLIPND